MALIRLRDELCQDGETCPALYQRIGHRTALVRGYLVTDPDTLAELDELNIPANEENIRVFDLAETRLPTELDHAPGDWWLIDGRDVVAMHYYPDGRFDGAEILDTHDVIRHRRAADAAWQHAQEFGPWWAAHPQHHHPSRTASHDR